jgi:hypothetical protein
MTLPEFYQQNSPSDRFFRLAAPTIRTSAAETRRSQYIPLTNRLLEHRGAAGDYTNFDPFLPDFSFWAMGGIVRTRMVFENGNVTHSLRRPVSNSGDC